MPCLRCHAENRQGRRFCAECGAALALPCPACGFANEPGEKFCGGCGQRLAEGEPVRPAPAAAPRPAPYTPRHLAEKILKARSALEGERRQVTVLFADLAGFTALAEGRDPEDVHRLMNRCFELITAEVHRLEGTVNQYTGDGIMALFGAPIAHEDGPRRAVHASLGIQRALRDYSRELQAAGGPSLRMRIGIHSGPVVVGCIGDDLRMDYTAVGDTTNLAARLQQAARPGGVLVSEATHKSIAGYFETLDLGELLVKGHAPVRAFEVLRPRGRRARLDVEAERGLTPLVAREVELAALTDSFGRVKAGHGQVVFVAGEAGIGKSRLLLEFRRSLAEAGGAATWLEGRCVSFGQSIPFLPMVDQLRDNFRIEEFDGEPEIIAKVEHGMRRMGELEAHIPFVRYLLSVDPGDPAVAGMDAAARRKRIFDAGRALSIRGARLRPLILVFEDLHWIDTSSEEYLASLMDSVAAVPLMLILTHRIGYASAFGTRSFYTMLMLRGLSEAEALTMAGRVLGVEQFPADLRTALMEEAGGVPLFVEEVTKALLDLGVLRREDGRLRMERGIAELSVPDTIQAIIMARLDRLGEDGKRMVQLASVIGRQFLLRLLERIAGLTGRLEGLLAELKALEIVYEQGLLPEPAYIFKHAVIQDVAYNSLLVQRRKELHRMVGSAIEELYSDRLAEHYEELAHHFVHGEEWPKAMEYSVLAGRRAGSSFANVEAKRHYARALDAAAKLVPPPDPLTRAELHERHGTVMMVLGEYEEAVAEYEVALDLVRLAGNRYREVEVLVGLSHVYHFYHRTEPAVEHSEQALAIARTLDQPALHSVALASRMHVRMAGYGELLDTAADGEEALRLARKAGDPKLLAQTLCYVGLGLQWRALYDRALVCLEEAFELAQRVHSGFLFGLSAFAIGHSKLATAEYEAALGWYQRLSEYSSAAGDKHFMARAPNCLAGVHLELYDLDEAIRLNVEGDEVARRVFPWPEPRGHSLVKLGLAYLESDKLAQADESLHRAAALLDQDVWMRWRWQMALLWARGALALRRKRPDEAWQAAAESLALATSTGSRKHMARARRLQGEILAAGGRADEAERELRASVGLAEEIRVPREAWLGRAALGMLLADRGRDREAEDELTAAARTVEATAAKLRTPALRRCFLMAEPVLAVYRRLGRAAPTP